MMQSLQINIDILNVTLLLKIHCGIFSLPPKEGLLTQARENTKEATWFLFVKLQNGLRGDHPGGPLGSSG